MSERVRERQRDREREREGEGGRERSAITFQFYYCTTTSILDCRKHTQLCTRGLHFPLRFLPSSPTQPLALKVIRPPLSNLLPILPSSLSLNPQSGQTLLPPLSAFSPATPHNSLSCDTPSHQMQLPAAPHGSDSRQHREGLFGPGGATGSATLAGCPPMPQRRQG